MSFSLPYISTGHRQRRIELPDFYLGFVSTEDISQLHYGLTRSCNQPSINRVKNAAISLAKQRKEKQCG